MAHHSVGQLTLRLGGFDGGDPVGCVGGLLTVVVWKRVVVLKSVSVLVLIAGGSRSLSLASLLSRSNEPRNNPANMPDRQIKHIAITTSACSKVVSRRGLVMTSLMLRLSSISDRKERRLCRLPRREVLSSPPPSPPSFCCWPGTCSSDADSSSVDGRGADAMVYIRTSPLASLEVTHEASTT